MADKAISIRQQPQDLIVFDDKKRELIRSTIAKSLLPPEFELFMAIASARGLDPVLNQIHAVKRKFKEGDQWVERMVIQVGIDGFRLIASRTGEYCGSDEITFETVNDKPVSAKATVYRMVGGQARPFVGTVRWSEFYPGDKQGFMWNKMPFNQLGKCAEAQALRRGFPGDLSGFYAPEELEREEIDVTPTTPKVTSSFADDPRIEKIKVLLEKYTKFGVSSDDISRKYGVPCEDLTDEMLTDLGLIGTEIKYGRLAVAVAFPPVKETF